VAPAHARATSVTHTVAVSTAVIGAKAKLLFTSTFSGCLYLVPYSYEDNDLKLERDDGGQYLGLNARVFAPNVPPQTFPGSERGRHSPAAARRARRRRRTARPPPTHPYHAARSLRCRAGAAPAFWVHGVGHRAEGIGLRVESLRFTG